MILQVDVTRDSSDRTLGWVRVLARRRPGYLVNLIPVPGCGVTLHVEIQKRTVFAEIEALR